MRGTMRLSRQSRARRRAGAERPRDVGTAPVRQASSCVFFSSLAMISVAVMFTPQGGNSLGVKKLSVRFDQ